MGTGTVKCWYRYRTLVLSGERWYCPGSWPPALVGPTAIYPERELTDAGTLVLSGELAVAVLPLLLVLLPSILRES